MPWNTNLCLLTQDARDQELGTKSTPIICDNYLISWHTVLHILALCSGRLLYPSCTVLLLQCSGDHQNSVSPVIQTGNILIKN